MMHSRFSGPGSARLIVPPSGGPVLVYLRFLPELRFWATPLLRQGGALPACGGPLPPSGDPGPVIASIREQLAEWSEATPMSYRAPSEEVRSE